MPVYVCAYGDLLKRPLVVLCVLPQSPRPTWQTGRPLKHIGSCCRSDNLSWSRTRSTWIWTVSASVPRSRPPTGPPCLSVCRRSTLHLPSTLSVATLRFPFSTSGQSLFTSQFAQNGQGVFSFLAISLHAWTASRPVDLEYVLWSAMKTRHH